MKKPTTRRPPDEYFILFGQNESRTLWPKAIEAVESMGKSLNYYTNRKTDPVEIARAFVAMRWMKDQIEALAKAFNEYFEPWKHEHFPAMLEAAGLSHVPLAEGYRVGVSNRFLAAIQEGKKAEALEWLRKNELSDLIQETVNAGTLSSAFQKMIEEHNIDPPEEIFHCHVQPNTSVTATKPSDRAGTQNRKERSGGGQTEPSPPHALEPEERNKKFQDD